MVNQKVSKNERIRQIVAAAKGEITANEVMDTLQKTGITVDRTSVNTAIRMYKQQTTPRAQVKNISLVQAVSNFVENHVDLTASEAVPMLKKEGIKVTAGYYTVIRSAYKRKTNREAITAGVEVLTKASDVIALVDAAKVLITKLGLAEAIRLIKAIS